MVSQNIFCFILIIIMNHDLIGQYTNQTPYLLQCNFYITKLNKQQQKNRNIEELTVLTLLFVSYVLITEFSW